MAGEESSLAVYGVGVARSLRTLCHRLEYDRACPAGEFTAPRDGNGDSSHLSLWRANGEDTRGARNNHRCGPLLFAEEPQD